MRTETTPHFPNVNETQRPDAVRRGPDDDAWDWMRNVYYIASEQRTLMAAVFLLTVILTILAYMLTTKVYESDISFVINESPYVFAVDPRANASDVSKLLIQSLINGMESEDMQTILAERLNVPPENLCFLGVTYPKPSYDKPNTARVDVQPVRNSRVAVITAYSHDPKFALRVAQEIMDEVLSLNTIVGRITSLQSDLAVVQGKITGLTASLVQSTGDRIHFDQDVQSLDQHLRSGGTLETYPAFQNDETLKNLMLQEAAAEGVYQNYAASMIRGMALQGKLGEMKSLKSQLDAYAKQLALGMRSGQVVARAREQSLEFNLHQQRTIADNIKDQIDKLTQSIGSYQMRRDLHLTSKTSAPGEKASVIVITDLPALGKRATMPNGLLYGIIGLFCAFAFSIGAGIFNHKFDRSVRNPKQLELLHGHTCLALLPESDTSSLGQPFGPVPEPESVAGLSYLRSQMLRATLTGAAEKVFVFSGLGRHSESAELVTKLAVLLAKAEKRTLLIDFNFTNPQIATLMGVKSHKGLSEWMFSEDKIQNFIEYSVIRELAVIQPGRITGNIDDLISRKPLSPVLAKLQEEWDFILINAPNLLEEAHLLLAAPAGSPVIAVARYADADVDDLDELAKRCEESNFVFAGIVLHHYPRTRLSGGRAAYELGAHRYVLESAAS